jgi:hypothetical protein
MPWTPLDQAARLYAMRSINRSRSTAAAPQPTPRPRKIVTRRSSLSKPSCIDDNRVLQLNASPPSMLRNGKLRFRPTVVIAKRTSDQSDELPAACLVQERLQSLNPAHIRDPSACPCERCDPINPIRPLSATLGRLVETDTPGIMRHAPPPRHTPRPCNNYDMTKCHWTFPVNHGGSLVRSAPAAGQ